MEMWSQKFQRQMLVTYPTLKLTYTFKTKHFENIHIIRVYVHKHILYTYIYLNKEWHLSSTFETLGHRNTVKKYTDLTF